MFSTMSAPARLALAFVVFLFLYFGFVEIVKDNGRKEQVIDQMVEDNKASEKKDVAVKEITEKEKDVIIEVLDGDQAAKDTKKKKKEESKRKVIDVQEDKTLSDNEKDIKVAEIEIGDLWSSFCDVNGANLVNGASCP